LTTFDPIHDFLRCSSVFNSLFEVSQPGSHTVPASGFAETQSRSAYSFLDSQGSKLGKEIISSIINLVCPQCGGNMMDYQCGGRCAGTGLPECEEPFLSAKIALDAWPGDPWRNPDLLSLVPGQGK
jgi:hypothetical protein